MASLGRSNKAGSEVWGTRNCQLLFDHFGKVTEQSEAKDASLHRILDQQIFEKLKQIIVTTLRTNLKFKF